jgi:hypothetical protein
VALVADFNSCRRYVNLFRIVYIAIIVVAPRCLERTERSLADAVLIGKVYAEVVVAIANATGQAVGGLPVGKSVAEAQLVP